MDTDRYVIYSFVHIRFCNQKNYLNFNQKGDPSDELREKGLNLWFECERKSKIYLKIIFGH